MDRIRAAIRWRCASTDWAHPRALRDLVEALGRCPLLDLVLLPKAGSAFDVRFVDHILTLLERELQRDKRLGSKVLIETSRGVANAEEIAASCERLKAMIFGDCTVDMRTNDVAYGTPSKRYAVLTSAQADGTPRARHWNDQWHFGMARIASTCHAHGMRVID